MKRESWKTKFFRWGMNLYPMYFGTGGRVLFISADWQEVRIKLPLNLWSRNYVGTLFGGSLFAATDPMYMLMYLHNLKGHVVWDKSASINFKRPGTGTAFVDFKIDDSELNEIRARADAEGEFRFNKIAYWKDKDGQVICEIDRLMFVATKEHYRKKLEARKTKSQ